MISNQNAQLAGTHQVGLFISSLLGLFAAGCASQNVDPAKPHAHTGYIDFVAEDDDLSWQVDRLDKTGQTEEVLYNTRRSMIGFCDSHWRRASINFASLS
jgi:hypothetical protein